MLWRKDVREDWSQRPCTPCSMLKAMQCPTFEKADREQILRILPCWKGKRILDLASGIGRFTGEFAREASHVTVVEWIPKFVEENQRRHAHFSNITYLCKDAVDVDFPLASFDLVFISFLFMYLTDEEMKNIASKIEQWTVPKGSIFVRESCEVLRVGPTDSNPTIYRTLSEYDTLFPQWAIKKEGSVSAWIEYLSRPLVCYWLFERIF